jgi:prepilin-type N-terminal cleavage/methylation domain-containing protein
MNFYKSLFFTKKEKAYTLLELLVVLSIIGLMMSIAVYGVINFRQTIIVSNTTKELMLQLRKARRYAINNVVTESGYTPRAYYIEITNDSNNYIKWGECNDSQGCFSENVKSAQSSGVTVSSCNNSSNRYSIIKFNHVTGDFIFTNANQSVNGTDSNCTITVNTGGAVSKRREIIVSRTERTIKIK